MVYFKVTLGSYKNYSYLSQVTTIAWWFQDAIKMVSRYEKIRNVGKKSWSRAHTFFIYLSTAGLGRMKLIHPRPGLAVSYIPQTGNFAFMPDFHIDTYLEIAKLIIEKTSWLGGVREGVFWKHG